MDPSTPPAQIGEVVGRYTTAAPVEMDAEAIAQLIAYVLCRAHQTACALMAPDEARAILSVAHSFADELAAANPGFDRLRFIRNATEDPS